MKLSKAHIFPLVLFVVLSFLTVFKINGTSLFQYGNYLGVNDNGLISGQSRPIRSDEWLVLTPFLMSQASNGFNQFNNKIGFGNDVLYQDFPFKGIFSFFRPNNFLFFFLDCEISFSFRWWFRLLLLLVVVYFFSLSVSNRKIILSILLSIAFVYSSFFQWWYSSAVLEPISYGLIIFWAFKKIIQHKNKKDLFIFGSVLSYFLLDFIFIIYPPFQVSVGLVILALCVGFLIKEWKTLSKSDWKRIILTLTLVVVIVLSVLFCFCISLKDILYIISNTSYPGRRVVSGGNYSFLHLLTSFFDIQLLNNFVTIPSFMSNNQCEASSFLMYSFIILPFIIFDFIKSIRINKKIDFIHLFVIVYFLLSLIWILFGLPKFLAKITLLNLVPENRMMIGIGLVNFILIIYYLFSDLKITKKYKILVFIYSIIISIIYLLIGFYLIKNYPGFIQKPVKVMFISVIVGLSTLFLLLRKKYLFVLIYLFFSLMTGLTVNPLNKGLTAITDNQLSGFVKEIKNNNGFVVVYGGNIANQILFANGVHTLGGVHIYPQLDLWNKFDPDGSDYLIYNRFAHVNFQLNEGKKDYDQVKFELNQADSFTVFINPCNKIFSDLNVKYVVLTKDDPFYTKCLNLEQSIETKSGKYFLYKKMN